MFFNTLIRTTFISLLIGSSAFASPVQWDPVYDTQDASDLFSQGQLVEAFNGAYNTADDEMVDSYTTTIGNTTFIEAPGLLSEDNNSDFLAGNTSGDAGYDVLLSTLDFGGGSGETILQTGSGNLTLGNTYMIQLWFTDIREHMDMRNMIFGDDAGNTVLVNSFGSGLGQYAIGYFTADSDSQSLTLSPDGFGNSHLNGYQIRDITGLGLVPAQNITQVSTPVSLFAFFGLLAIAGLSPRKNNVKK